MRNISYLLKYGSPPIRGSIASAIDRNGPFDRDSFKKANPYILVLTPKSWTGQVEQFIKRWRDGELKNPYAKGFVNKYALRGCDFTSVDLNETNDLANDYETACLRAIKESRENVKRYDLAFIVTSESHRLLGQHDPDLISKAALMGNEIPVQALEIETIKSSPDSWRFIMNNIALACYAKMEGTPWVLATSKGQGLSHEIVIGLGSATIRDSRLGETRRYVGIAI